ncbi:MAG: hypothetical protein Kow001_05620 [Acidobacteriota bacterium]
MQQQAVSLGIVLALPKGRFTENLLHQGIKGIMERVELEKGGQVGTGLAPPSPRRDATVWDGAPPVTVPLFRLSCKLFAIFCEDKRG